MTSLFLGAGTRESRDQQMQSMAELLQCYPGFVCSYIVTQKQCSRRIEHTVFSRASLSRKRRPEKANSPLWLVPTHQLTDDQSIRNFPAAFGSDCTAAHINLLGVGCQLYKRKSSRNPQPCLSVFPPVRNSVVSLVRPLTSPVSQAMQSEYRLCMQK